MSKNNQANSETMKEVHKNKNKLTQSGSHILMLILMSHMMITKAQNPQKVSIFSVRVPVG